MSCEIVTATGGVFVLWGKPTREDMDQIEAQLHDMVARFGRPVTYVTRVPAQAPAPDADVRKHVNSRMPTFAKACSTYHVVLEGDGFLAAMKRGILTSMFQLGFRKGSFFVHSSVEEVSGKVDAADRARVEELLLLAKRGGLLDRAHAISIPPPARSHLSP